MSSIDANHSGRRGRLWIVETIVVLGIVAFGYYALTAESTPAWSETPAATGAANPLLDLIR